MTPGDPIHIRSFTGAVLPRRVLRVEGGYVRVAQEAEWLQFERDGVEPTGVGFAMADVVKEHR